MKPCSFRVSLYNTFSWYTSLQISLLQPLQNEVLESLYIRGITFHILLKIIMGSIVILGAQCFVISTN